MSFEDERAIERLIARYNFAIDGLRSEEVAACYTRRGRFLVDDAVMAEGSEGLQRFAAGLAAQMPLRHIVSSILIDVEGDRATSLAYCQVFRTNPEKGAHVLAQGIYRDQLERQDGQWLFAERRFARDPS